MDAAGGVDLCDPGARTRERAAGLVATLATGVADKLTGRHATAGLFASDCTAWKDQTWVKGGRRRDAILP